MNGGQPTIEYRKNLVFLFKAPKENEEDKFVVSLLDAKYEVVTIPVLSFKYLNTDVLSQCFQHIDDYSAIIFTSTKAVDAVNLATKQCDNDVNINNIVCYVVGKSTADAARRAGFSTKGEETGNAVELSKLIISDHSKSSDLPILYPCANIRRDTLCDLMKQNDIIYKEVIAYETCKNERLEEAVQTSIDNRGIPEYCVFFSPSGVQYTHPLVVKGLLPLHRTKVAAIGPTTESELLQHGITIYGVAEKPDPESLLKILNREENIQR
ncbi:hypothetical protein SNE40_017642 [Patella caerulea]|uniref:Uroporphyrinogen-III synthase n=1 Tax=Patella caerulea TaxID=87958 RepID=A0AAN8PQ93_PATCE